MQKFLKMNEMKKLLFEEHQIQRRGLPWLIVLLIWTLSIYQISIEKFSEENVLVDLILLIVMPLIVSLLLFLLKLSVIVTNESISYKMFPFHWDYRKINFDQIKKATMQEYNTSLGFHGWGIGPFWNNKYRSYTIKGKKGIELVLKNGNVLFIGSARADELMSLINLLKQFKRSRQLKF